jgi:hypothetical protein
MARSSGASVWTNTRDATATAMLVPMPMLMFDVKGSGSPVFTGSMPIRQVNRHSPDERPRATSGGRSTGAKPAAEEPPRELEAVAQDAAGSSEAAAAVLEAPDASEPQAPPEAQAPAETLDVDSEPVEAPEPEPQPSAESHRIELIIDSLPRHQLNEAIPVTIDSLGDQVFTATVHALQVVGTGNTLGDALIIVKEQIEILYERLSKATGLDSDEKKHLTYLQSHIKSSGSETPRHSKRSIWR